MVTFSPDLLAPVVAAAEAEVGDTECRGWCCAPNPAGPSFCKGQVLPTCFSTALIEGDVRREASFFRGKWIPGSC